MRKGPLPFRYVFLITFVIFNLFTFQGLWIINKGIEPTLMAIAETRIAQMATLAINEAIKSYTAEELNLDNLVLIEKDTEGQITTIGWNAPIVQLLLNHTTKNVQDYLHAVEKGNMPPPDLNSEEIAAYNDPSKKGVIAEIPLGQATNNILLANLGPVIPVRFSVIGDVNTDMRKKVTEYGINNVLVELSIHIEVDIRVTIPFASDTVTVTSDIPVDIRTIQGEVPYFYNSGEGGEPSIEAPLP